MNKKSLTKKDYEKIISIQESIIKLKENEFKIIERVFDRVLDTSDNYRQWAFWYRAWSEYLESTIQKYFKTKKHKVFDNYKKVIEIGPGMGVLTQFLIEKTKDLNLIEIDSYSVSYLKNHYKSIEKNNEKIYKNFLDEKLGKNMIFEAKITKSP